MAREGKIENWGAGSRRAPQQGAERRARRSQKRAGERRWRREEEGRSMWDVALPPPASSVHLALVPAMIQAQVLSDAVEEMTALTERLFSC